MNEKIESVEAQGTEALAKEETSIERKPRESEGREAEKRQMSWEDPINLPSPDPVPGWIFSGCLLCKMPKEMAEAREEHFARMSKNQIDSVDNAYFKDQDPRMPTKQVFERKSRTSFGRDS